MRRVLVPATLLAVAATVAASLPMSSRVERLTDDINARIVVIENLAVPTVEALKERSSLVKARGTFYSWGGSFDVKDLGLLAKGLGVACKATRDANVAVSAADVRAGFVAIAGDSRTAAESARDELMYDSHREKITAAIDRAVASVDAGTALPDWGKGAKTVLKGIAGLRKAEALARKLLATENV